MFDRDGYFAAVEAQREKADNAKYNRLDFLGDVTFEEDVTFGDFDHYWVDSYWTSGETGQDGEDLDGYVYYRDAAVLPGARP